jgi:O-antigen/teichoic acid export membrane protein
VFDADDRRFAFVVRNLSTGFLAVVVDAILGLVMLPFNVLHLGTAAYGLWILTGSVTAHFSILNMGYGGALVKFVAHYRARRDERALNEIASTLLVIFAAIGCVAYGVAAIVAFHLDSLFRMTPEQAEIGQWVLLITGVNVALNFPFSVFGGVVNGFQRQHLNAAVGIGSSVLIAAVNVVVLTAGFGLVALVMATTAVRLATYVVYASNAYRIFPGLRLRPSLFRRDRLREVTGFSVYALVIDWSYKLNYQLDQIVIGAFLGVAPVAVWAVADRIVGPAQTVTNQLKGVLFPVIVDTDALEEGDRLRQIFLHGTRLSLATVLPVVTALVVLADPLVRAWVGARKPELLGSVPVLQLLALGVAIRIGNGTAMTLLKGAGQHRLLALVNLATAVANVALSVALVRVWGLVGVAVGTLVPVAISTFFVVFPTACRRAGLPLGRVLVHSVLPAVWPAIVVAAVLALTRQVSTETLPGVMVQVAFGVLLYYTLYVAAIGPRDRTLYTAKVFELFGRRFAPVAQ